MVSRTMSKIVQLRVGVLLLPLLLLLLLLLMLLMLMLMMVLMLLKIANLPVVPPRVYFQPARRQTCSASHQAWHMTSVLRLVEREHRPR